MSVCLVVRDAEVRGLRVDGFRGATMIIGHVGCDHVTGVSDGENELEAPGWSIRSD